MNSKKSYHKLIDGNERFVNSIQINNNINVATNDKLGDLFAVNIANQSSIASIEYTISQLSVKLIVVLSYENCDAIKYTYDQEGSDCETKQNFNHLLKQIRSIKFENYSITKKELSLKNAA